MRDGEADTVPDPTACDRAHVTTDGTVRNGEGARVADTTTFFSRVITDDAADQLYRAAARVRDAASKIVSRVAANSAIMHG